MLLYGAISPHSTPRDTPYDTVHLTLTHDPKAWAGFALGILCIYLWKQLRTAQNDQSGSVPGQDDDTEA